MQSRIAINPNVNQGQTCIRGTRIPVSQMVHMLANGDSIEKLLAEYPSLKQEDISAALEYAANLAESSRLGEFLEDKLGCKVDVLPQRAPRAETAPVVMADLIRA